MESRELGDGGGGTAPADPDNGVDVEPVLGVGQIPELEEPVPAIQAHLHRTVGGRLVLGEEAVALSPDHEAAPGGVSTAPQRHGPPVQGRETGAGEGGVDIVHAQTQVARLEEATPTLPRPQIRILRTRRQGDHRGQRQYPGATTRPTEDPSEHASHALTLLG